MSVSSVRPGLVHSPAAEAASLLLDVSCGHCAECLAGAPLWCAEPVAEGRPVLDAPVSAEAVRALLGAAALLEVPEATCVLVVGSEEAPLARLLRLVHRGPVIAAETPASPEARAELATLDPSGRAPVVVTAGAARPAVLAVRRGGHVCLAGDGDELPSITELVQREVTLLTARDLGVLTQSASPDQVLAVLHAA